MVWLLKRYLVFCLAVLPRLQYLRMTTIGILDGFRARLGRLA
jgi:hypothetical protein